MKLILSTFLAAAAVAVCSASVLPSQSQSQPSGRIIGGVDALPGEFPQICIVQWVLLTSQTTICACAIINLNHVVTAAHCITEAPTTGRLEVLGGVLQTNIIAPQRQRLGVMQQFIHPDFNASGPRRNDIAILRLQSPFGVNEWIQPALLPAAGAVATGATMIAGWGQTSTGILPPTATHLQKIQAAVVPFTECRNSLLTFGLDLQEGFMCTGPLSGGIGVCAGDSGGPVLQNNVLLGIISFTTSPCAAVGSASVHVDIASYIPWINGIVPPTTV